MAGAFGVEARRSGISSPGPGAPLQAARRRRRERGKPWRLQSWRAGLRERRIVRAGGARVKTAGILYCGFRRRRHTIAGSDLFRSRQWRRRYWGVDMVGAIEMAAAGTALIARVQGMARFPSLGDYPEMIGAKLAALIASSLFAPRSGRQPRPADAHLVPRGGGWPADIRRPRNRLRLRQNVPRHLHRRLGRTWV